MILFDQILIVRSIEHKNVPTKAGKNFHFVEAICNTDEEKPTILVARLAENMEENVRQGEKSKFRIGVTSYEGKDGRVWNNFILVGKQDLNEKPKAEPEQPTFDDELPF